VSNFLFLPAGSGHEIPDWFYYWFFKPFSSNLSKQIFYTFLYEPINSELRLTVLHYLKIYSLNCS